MLTLRVNNTEIPGIELVIFDKDGTLIDFYHYWSQIVFRRANLLQEALNLPEGYWKDISEAMGVDFTNKRFRPEGPVGVLRRKGVEYAVTTYLENITIHPRPNKNRVVHEIFNQVDEEMESDITTYVKVLPGVYEFISALERAHIPYALATTDNSYRAKLVLDYMGLSSMPVVLRL
jgi:phosphoglycolate phosphatase-like HAD superfamily hydrolase